MYSKTRSARGLRGRRWAGGFLVLGLLFGLLTLNSTSASAAPAVVGSIRTKWIALGGATGTMGQAIDVERPTFDNVGRSQEFQRGTISWHPNVGAFSVRGAIRSRWVLIGREMFGYPRMDEGSTPDGVGRFEHFVQTQYSGAPETSIYWTSSTGAVEIFGEIRSFWKSIGWERSSLRYPTNPESNRDGGVIGRQQRFQGGTVVWTPSDGAAISHSRLTASGVDRGDPVTGNLDVVIFPNGNWQFSGHLHNSGTEARNVSGAIIIRTSSGQVFQFAASGHTGGTFDTDSRDFNWNQSGNNAAIAAAWPALSRSSAGTWQTSSSSDWGRLLRDLRSAAGTVREVVTVVAAVA